MKLSNFYNRDETPKRQSKQAKFVLSNGRLEVELETEKNKNSQIQEQYDKLFNENDELTKQLIVAQEHSKTISIELDKTLNTLDINKASYNEAQQKIQEIPDFKQRIRELEANNTNLNSIIESAQRNSLQQGADLERVMQERDMFNDEKTQFATELEQRRKDVSSFQAKADEFKIKFEGIQTVMENLKTEYKEIQHSRNVLHGQATYFEAKATELYERVQVLEGLDVKLRQWIDNLQTDSTEAKSASKSAKQKIGKLTALISDMGTTIADLTSDKDYLSQMNAALKKELAKPKFMSMGAIARKEGFKMPTNSENVRTKFLGNAAPTLLKFKVKEENNAR
tara:strand:- start:5192 stop:6208 length:1017 start_codon:yes stop_codon:yes gene_type:complete